MRRALLEWGGLFSACIAVICLAYWFISLLTSHSMHLAYSGDVQVHVAAENGQLTFTKWFLENLDGLKYLDGIGKGQVKGRVSVTRNVGLDLPGFGFRYLTFSDSSMDWYLRMSLLVPFAVFSLLGASLLYRFRVAKRSSGSKRAV